MKTKQFTILIFVALLLCNKQGVSQTSTLNLSDGKMVVNVATNLVILGDFKNSADGDNAISLSGEMAISGDFTNNANSGNLLMNSTGKVVFNGSTKQAINGSKETYFSNMEIDNAEGIENITIKTYIKGLLELTDGIISTCAGNELVLQDGSSYSGGSNSSFIDGPMTKVGASDFTFPVGNVDMVAQIGISGLKSSETFTAQYFKTPHANSDVSGTVIEAVSIVEYWYLSPESVNPTINITLHYGSGDFSGIKDPALLIGAHYDATNTRWEEIAYISSTGGATSGSITFGPVSNFSNFTFGSTDIQENPLPIELLSFNATANENITVNLEWSTATEIYNDFFTIEKSIDGEKWDYVGEQKGAGNSNSQINYSMIDTKPYNGTSYYRLKQTDFDGTYAYSDIRSVQFQSIGELSVYPNPASTYFVVEGLEQRANLILYNDIGQIVKTVNINPNEKINVSELAPGQYILKIIGTQQSIKIIIQ